MIHNKKVNTTLAVLVSYCDLDTDLDLGSGCAGHHLGNLAQVNAACQVHLARMDLQNIKTSLQPQTHSAHETTQYNETTIT